MNLPPKLIRIFAVQLAAFGLVWLAPQRALAQSSACDLNNDTSTNVADVQLSVNMVLGLTACTANLVSPGVCNVVVVQRVVNAAIGGPCVSDSAPIDHNVRLSWNASTSSGVSGHNIYRGTASGGPYSKVNTSLVTGTTYLDTSVQDGQTYFYVVRAVNNSSLESNNSNQAMAAVP